jgi:hypothetical protein
MARLNGEFGKDMEGIVHINFLGYSWKLGKA